jgi:hypothetical protein
MTAKQQSASSTAHQEVHCPQCGYELDIQALIQMNAQEEITKQLKAQRLKLEMQLAQEKEMLLKEQQDLMIKRESEAIAKAKAEQETALKMMEAELKAKSQQVQELNTLKVQKLQLEREKAEQLSLAEAEKNEAILRAKHEFEAQQQSLIAKREAEAVAKTKAEQETALKMMETELKAKSQQVQELNTLKAQKLQLEREKAELALKIEAEKQAQFNQQLVEERQKIARQEAEKNELQVVELRKQLDDQRQLTEEMKRRQEQGSMQLQGEAQELAIEAFLKQTFPYDEISDVGKGDMGADSLHTVYHRGQPCGSIYYESKRTKTFQEAWIPKFKKDMMARNVDIGVLVTAIYPKGMERMGIKEGVYICSYSEFKSLCLILRQLVIQVYEANMAQENRGEKTAMLYSYLTSNEFKLQFEGIVSAFVTMKNDLEAEKRAIQTQWKKREKQLDNVLLSTTAMYGSIKGIAGAAVADVPLLEASGFEALPASF